jgi:hypothetical protein
MKKNIYSKLFALQNELGAITKDAKNPFYKSKYFDINSLIGQLKPLLEKHKLVLIQPITDNQVRSVLIDLEGGSVESAIMLPDNLDAQKLGSAITYFRRYTLQSLLALQAVDDDGNLASIKNENKKPKLIENTPQFKNALNGMQKGATINDIKKVYTVTNEIEKKLLNFKI